MITLLFKLYQRSLKKQQIFGTERPKKLSLEFYQRPQIGSIESICHEKQFEFSLTDFIKIMIIYSDFRFC